MMCEAGFKEKLAQRRPPETCAPDDVTLQQKLGLLAGLAEHCNQVVDRLTDSVPEPMRERLEVPVEKRDAMGVRAALQMSLDRFGCLLGKLEALAGEIGRL